MSNESAGAAGRVSPRSRSPRSRFPSARTDRNPQGTLATRSWDDDDAYAALRYLWRAERCAKELRNHRELTPSLSKIVAELSAALEDERVRAGYEWRDHYKAKARLRKALNREIDRRRIAERMLVSQGIWNSDWDESTSTGSDSSR